MDTPPPVASQRLRVASSLDRLEEVLAWFARLRHPPLPEMLWVQGETALVEAFSNAVRHAHGPLADPPPVELEAWLGEAEFGLVISDHGPPFDLRQALDDLQGLVDSPDFDPLERGEHWGLIFLLRLRDEHGWSIGLERTREGRNRLRVSHPLGTAS
ncbi:MAG: hypothetical protein ER33_01105 [Cyanobium sp. CACIAM 14]|nr:MAG: hypothetical protein ER33_01105 [Cyanobium sp. CACIAM 14]